MPLEEKKKHIKKAGDPLVSIITPLYNAASYIAESITSVKNQTYPHWEHLIVDDASTDASIAIAEAFAKQDNRIHLVQNTQNSGAASCRNQATELAKGSYIAFLDADDLWHPEKLEKQIAFMVANAALVSATSYVHIDEAGKSVGKRIQALPVLTYKQQHSNNYIGNLTGIYNTEVLGKIMAPNIRKRQDWAVWLIAIERSEKPALGLQEDLAQYRVHEASMSSNKWNLVRHNFNFYRKYLRYSWLASVYFLARFFWEYFFVRPKYIEKIN